MTNNKDRHYQQILNKITLFFEKNIYILFLILTAANFISPDFFTAPYEDPDSYMRAIRIKNWLQTPSFFEQIIPQSNYPFGEISHWTRPIDILWLICSLPFISLPTTKEIIFAGGHLISPLLCLLAICALIYGLKSRFNIWLTIFGCFLFLTNPPIQSFFRPTYPDHHPLMITLSLYAMALMMHWQQNKQEKYLRRLGITLAAMTMVVIEGILISAIFFGWFFGRFIFQNRSFAPIISICRPFAITLTICWLINPPYEGWFYPDNARISVLYIAAVWLAYIFLYKLQYLPLKTRTSKLAALTATAAIIAAILILLFGKQIISSPLDDTLQNIWGFRIWEMQHFWNYPLTAQLKYYAFATSALLLNVWLLKHHSCSNLMRLNLAIGLPLFILSLYAGRFFAYQPIYTITPYICFIRHLYLSATTETDFPPQIWIAATIILLLQQLASTPSSLNTFNKPQTDYFATQLCNNIQEISGTLVADVFFIEKYMWDCNVNAVGTTYHRNRTGLIDNHNILYGTDNLEILSILQKHQVTQILLFANYDKNYYNMDKIHQNKLYYRLLNRENIPPYLTEIPSEVNNARHFKINYNVDFPLPMLENIQ